MTIREKVLRELTRRPWQTMTQVAHRIGHAPASVSSVMHRMRTARVLGSTRLRQGPRGGVTYARWGADVLWALR